jgi:pimeloyl-ACP methyl ester carboxylesterase
MSGPRDSGYCPVDGFSMYWERYGEAGGSPLIVVPGGFGVVSRLRPVLHDLAQRRPVIAVELQGHGHTPDTERLFSYQAFGDDLAGVVDHLQLGAVDLLGYSLGAGACLRAAVQHPKMVRRLVVTSFPFRRDGWFPEIRWAFDHLNRSAFDQLKNSPMYRAWAEVAPDPDCYPTIIDKMGELQRNPYDWEKDISRIEARTLLIFGDADSIGSVHIAEFFALLGGGLHDAGVDGSARPLAQLAVLPGTTHYDIVGSPGYTATVDRFLG